MPIPFALGDAVDLTDVSIQRIWLKSSKLHKVTYFDKYVNVERGVTDRLLKDSSITGLGQAARIPEQGIVVSEAPIQGYDVTYTQVEFGKILPVTKQMLKNFGISWMETSLHKLCKLREHLFETIRSQATAIKKAVEGSTTIIRAPLGVMG